MGAHCFPHEAPLVVSCTRSACNSEFLKARTSDFANVFWCEPRRRSEKPFFSLFLHTLFVSPSHLGRGLVKKYILLRKFETGLVESEKDLHCPARIKTRSFVYVFPHLAVENHGKAKIHLHLFTFGYSYHLCFAQKVFMFQFHISPASPPFLRFSKIAEGKYFHFLYFISPGRYWGAFFSRRHRRRNDNIFIFSRPLVDWMLLSFLDKKVHFYIRYTYKLFCYSRRKMNLMASRKKWVCKKSPSFTPTLEEKEGRGGGDDGRAPNCS